MKAVLKRHLVCLFCLLPGTGMYFVCHGKLSYTLFVDDESFDPTSSEDRLVTVDTSVVRWADFV